MSSATTTVTKNPTAKVLVASSRPDFHVRMVERLPPTTTSSFETDLCTDPANNGAPLNAGHDQGPPLISHSRSNPHAAQPCAELNEARREQLVLDHLPQVRYAARRIHSRISRRVPIEDLVNAGIVGLIQAVRKYDPKRNVQLKYFAEFRIQGAILDSLRQGDWIPRGLRRRARDFEQAISNYKSRFGRDPNERELAMSLGIRLEVLQRLQRDLQHLQADRIETIGEDAVSLRTVSEQEDAYHHTLRSERSGLLAKALDELTDRERQVVTMYYFQELTMSEVGMVLGIGESRISQIHSAALLRLRTRLRGSI